MNVPLACKVGVQDGLQGPGLQARLSEGRSILRHCSLRGWCVGPNLLGALEYIHGYVQDGAEFRIAKRSPLTSTMIATSRWRFRGDANNST